VEINGKTEVYGIVGQPVAHSLSPLFQTHFLQSAGIDAVYVPFAVETDQLEAALHGLWAAGVQGLNVTVPHKESALPLVAAAGQAHIIGAINTLVRTDEGWQGHNTDWLGFAALLEGLHVPLDGASVLMFGAGGTARAVVHALASRGVSRLGICNRSEERARELMAHIKKHYNSMACELVPWSQTSVEIVSHDCVTAVNVTSIGLAEDDAFPFHLQGKGVAVDAVYRPDGQTAFCRMAKSAGWQTADGLPMLIAQGAEAFALWHQCRRPDMLDTLRWIERKLGRMPIDIPGWEAA